MGVMLHYNERLFSEQVEQLHIQAGTRFIVNLLYASVLVFMMRSVVANDGLLLSWWGALLFGEGLFLAVSYCYHRYTPPPESTLIWFRLFVFALILSGVVWGLSGVIFLTQADLGHRLFLGFILANMVAGLVQGLASVRHVYLLYVCLVLAPVTLQLVMSSDPIEFAMGIMFIMYIAILHNAANRMHSTIVNDLESHLKLQQLVHVDALTKIANRRCFDETFKREWARGQRASSPISLLLIDIDKYKEYNDYYGHQAGDHCLAKIASCLENNVKRSSDLVARYGGEEFAVLLPETSWSGAITVAEKLREAIFQLQIPHTRSEVAPFITVTIGVAVCIPAKETTPQHLIELADVGLYQGKRNGRNQVDWQLRAESVEKVNQKQSSDASTS